MEKVAVVTGAARGIGRAISEKLAENGFFVLLSDIISAENARDAIESVRKIGCGADYFKCDISDSGDRDALTAYVENTYKRVDVLVNNAGIAPAKRDDILLTSEESLDRLISVNLKGTFFMCQNFANLMLKLKDGEKGCLPKIINISSVSAYASSAHRAEYCISKAGVSMATKVFADRLANEGISVFEVRPGIIMTDMTAVVKDKYQKMIQEGVTPVKRFGQPEDVANCVLAAASGLLDFGTGSVLNADGGFHIQRL